MIKKFFITMFFGCVFFMTACDKNNGDGPNPPASDDDITDITFNMTEDTVTSPIEGGDLSLGYSLSSRPEEGQFVVTMLSGESWVSYVADNPESNSLTVNVESNDGEPREGILAIRFDYNGGSLLDSVTISQEGKDYDVFIDAKDLDGEYYTGEKDYYIWVSTLGMWETGSEGLNIDLYAEGEPEVEDYLWNGTPYKRVISIPEGTYTFDPSSHAPGTFSNRSFYGVASGYYYIPQYYITEGTVEVKHLEGGVTQFDARVLCTDGKWYRLSYTGDFTGLAYVNE